MKKRHVILGLTFLIALSVHTGGHHDVRWVPRQWCGANPPYTGTLWIGSTYGVPFNWLEVGRYEKYTTITSIIPDMGVYPDGLLANFIVFAIPGLLFRLYEKVQSPEVSET